MNDTALESPLLTPRDETLERSPFVNVRLTPLRRCLAILVSDSVIYESAVSNIDWPQRWWKVETDRQHELAVD